MQPNLALILSFEGIALWHCAAEGWTLLGTVPLDAPGLAGELAALRGAALALEPSGLRSKVVLPPEEVRLFELADPEADDVAAHAALGGEAGDLVIDREVVNGRMLVAAVARDTLREAEAFAAGHGFEPVSLAAPDPGFGREAIFVETADEPHPDALPVADEAASAADAEVAEPSSEPTPTILAARPRPLRGEDLGLGATAPWASAEPDDADRPAHSGWPLQLPQRPVASPQPAARPAGAAAGAGRARPRHLALAALAVALLVLVAAVGVLASASDRGLAGLLGGEATVAEDVEVASSRAAAEAPPAALEAATAAVAAAMADAEPATNEAPEPGAVTGAVTDAAPGAAVSPQDADRFYAATGVWLRAPRLPIEPEVEDAALPADPDGAADAAEAPKSLALPRVPAAVTADAGLAAQTDPPPPGTSYARDERGLILATEEGKLNPAGVLLVAGSPPVEPPSRPAASVPALMTEPAALEAEAVPPLAADPVTPAEALAALGAAPTADGVMPVTPPGALAFAADEGAAATAGGVSLAGLRPATRPADQPEAAPAPEPLASFDGPRPNLRPEGLAPVPAAVAEAPSPENVDPEAVEAALASAAAGVPEAAPAAAPDLQSALATIVADAPDPLAGATPQAVPVARIPDARPRDFDRVVSNQLARTARAAQPAPPTQGGVGTGGLEPEEQAENEPEVASAAAAQPSGPISGGVAQAATFADAMALREMNLVGVYGQPSARRALVRLGNGRYLRVGVGDNLDGGRVTAIGDNALNYSRRGRTETLVIPGG